MSGIIAELVKKCGTQWTSALEDMQALGTSHWKVHNLIANMFLIYSSDGGLK